VNFLIISIFLSKKRLLNHIELFKNGIGNVSGFIKTSASCIISPLKTNSSSGLRRWRPTAQGLQQKTQKQGNERILFIISVFVDI
jgi:hypothetical protein